MHSTSGWWAGWGLVALLAAGCGAYRQPSGSAAGRPAARPVSALPDAAGPERAASNQLIVEGQQFMDTSFYDQAADRFQEAINVDPFNGPAYYYYATAKLRLGLFDAVGPALDKAEQLIGPDAVWQQRIAALRLQAQAGLTQ